MTVAQARLPQTGWGAITFTDKLGAKATGKAKGRPSRGAESDGFRAGVAIAEKHRSLVVLPDELAFAPKSGMYAAWEGSTWIVLGAAPLSPGGDLTSTGAVVMYAVTLTR